MSALCLRYPALRRDLRVEAFAGANGLRAITLMNNKAWRKLNSPVGCSPGRAAKGASPFVRTTQTESRLYVGSLFVLTRLTKGLESGGVCASPVCCVNPTCEGT